MSHAIHPFQISLSVNQTTATLTAEMVNNTERPLTLRRFDPYLDLRVQGPRGLLASQRLSGLGMQVPSVRLAPADRVKTSFDLLRDYAFPVPGEYVMTCHYRSRHGRVIGRVLVDDVEATCDPVRLVIYEKRSGFGAQH